MLLVCAFLTVAGVVASPLTSVKKEASDDAWINNDNDLIDVVSGNSEWVAIQNNTGICEVGCEAPAELVCPFASLAEVGTKLNAESIANTLGVERELHVSSIDTIIDECELANHPIQCEAVLMNSSAMSTDPYNEQLNTCQLLGGATHKVMFEFRSLIWVKPEGLPPSIYDDVITRQLHVDIPASFEISPSQQSACLVSLCQPERNKPTVMATSPE